MKYLVVVLTLAMTTVAMAQILEPKVMRLIDNATGKHIGTATLTENRLYVRGPNEEFYAQIVINPDGSKTAYDENGKEIDLEHINDLMAPP